MPTWTGGTKAGQKITKMSWPKVFAKYENCQNSITAYEQTETNYITGSVTADTENPMTTYRTIRYQKADVTNPCTTTTYRDMIFGPTNKSFKYWLGTRGCAADSENNYFYCQVIEGGQVSFALVSLWNGAVTNLESRGLRPFVTIPKDTVTWEKTEDGNIKISY